MIIDKIINEAKILNKTIILPESMDKRIIEAAKIITKEKIANIILIGKEREKIDNVSWIDPETSPLLEEYITKLYEMRKEKGMTLEKARELLLNDYMYFACMLVIDKKADGIVSGACHSTSDTLRPSLQIIKKKEDAKIVSGLFLMELENQNFGENGIYIFSDSGLIQDPSSEELAYIAYNASESFKNLVGKEPKVAFLSHSTKGSAKHELVDKVKNAYNMAKDLYPNILMDGELQLDAAIVPEVAASKTPDSPLKGRANILIFPNLDAGNIGYKLVQRLAGANAYGPLTSGMRYPVNDLSRGCSTSDIVGVVAITALQSK